MGRRSRFHCTYCPASPLLHLYILLFTIHNATYPIVYLITILFYIQYNRKCNSSWEERDMIRYTCWRVAPKCIIKYSSYWFHLTWIFIWEVTFFISFLDTYTRYMYQYKTLIKYHKIVHSKMKDTWFSQFVTMLNGVGFLWYHRMS